MRYMKLFCVMALCLSIGCATPIGTREKEPEKIYQQLNINALAKGEYGLISHNVLHRHYLLERFSYEPEEVIKQLHQKVSEDERRDLLFALAELSYLTADTMASGFGRQKRARAIRARAFFLVSAIYAYRYLFDEDIETPPNPYARQFRTACDLYNNALARAFTMEDGKLDLTEGLLPLPEGNIKMSLDASQFSWDLNLFDDLWSADKFEVFGLTVRNRFAGIGAPFIARESVKGDRILRREVPGTILLRPKRVVVTTEDGEKKETYTATLEIYSAFENDEVKINNNTVPLERDLTVQLAHTLDQSRLWDVGLEQFISGASLVKSGIYYEAFHPDKIPVVLVHGTMSSPVWWAQMLNTLRADPIISQSYQFWFYLYDSGKPTSFSARHLRKSIMDTLRKVDPESKSPALEQMILIGHSQGGLLAKLNAVDRGERLIKAVTGKTLDELDLNDAQEEVVRREAIWTPLPNIERVVFISTPHRGSFLAINWIRRWVKKIVSMPGDMLKHSALMVQSFAKLKLPEEWKNAISVTSIDSMSPSNPGLQLLADMPLAKDITGHSIIAIKGDETPPDGDDGVVKYKSAHLDYVASEFIVRSGHSCQGHPLVIEEVRRILYQHLKGDH